MYKTDMSHGCYGRIQACNSSTWKAETVALEFEAILGYIGSLKSAWAT